MTALSCTPRMAARVVGLAAALSLLLGAPFAEAIPAFARKYETSCQTCHIVFPKLNAFGTAFRLNGYRMPKETEEMVKEKPVSLGAPAYKKLWPQAIWPGEISSAVPLAVNIKFADVNTSSLNEDGTTSSVKNDFQFPQEVNIFGGGQRWATTSPTSARSRSARSGDGSVSTEIEHAHISHRLPLRPRGPRSTSGSASSRPTSPTSSRRCSSPPTRPSTRSSPTTRSDRTGARAWART